MVKIDDMGRTSLHDIHVYRIKKKKWFFKLEEVDWNNLTYHYGYFRLYQRSKDTKGG